jgi:hypothetical protein
MVDKPSVMSNYMKRRAILILAFGLGMGGCLTNSTTEDEDPTATPEAILTPTDDGVRVTPSQFDGKPCPRFYKSETTCYHELPPGRPDPPALIPVAEQATDDPPSFLLANKSSQTYVARHADREVMKQTPEGWKRVDPLEVVFDYDSEKHIPPGAVYETEPKTATLGQGRYALYIGGRFEDGEGLALVGLFEMATEPLQLEPDDITTETRDGDHVYLETEKGRDDNETVRVTFETGADLDKTGLLAAETAFQTPTLRNAIPYLQQPGISSVEILTNEYAPFILDVALSLPHESPPFHRGESPPTNYPTGYRDITFTADMPDKTGD